MNIGTVIGLAALLCFAAAGIWWGATSMPTQRSRCDKKTDNVASNNKRLTSDGSNE